MRKSTIFTLALLAAISSSGWAQDDYSDDIYFNPKKEKNNPKKQHSAYIADFGNIDVDAYNRRGDQYYVTPIDTVGVAEANGEDFVYTQKIQKFYNPTIIVDNADVLQDVLNDSYGNVEIVLDVNGYPTFVPYYSYTYGWPISYWSPSWSWRIGWGPSWAWGPSWSWGPGWGWDFGWNWGPSWAWGPSWGWGPGWGWDWGWGPSWGSGWSHNYYANHYRPGANRRPNHPEPGWASNTRPGGGGGVAGGNYGGGANSGIHGVASNSAYSYVNGGHRVNKNSSATTSTVNGHRPGNSGSSSAQYKGYDYHRGAGAFNSADAKIQSTATYRGNSSGSSYNRGSYNSGSTYRGSTNTGGYNSHRGSSSTSRYGTSSGNSYRSSGSSNRSSGSSYRSSGNSHRSSSGSFRSSGGGSSRGGGFSGGGSRGGGGGGGRHR